MPIPSRKAARYNLADELFPLLTAVDTGASYAYEPADFKGKSPVVYLCSDGSDRPPFTNAGIKTTFYFNLHLLVLYADLEGKLWYEKDAADGLDDLECQLTDAMTQKRMTPGKWKNLFRDGRSRADLPEIIGGEMYLHEIITVGMEVF